MRFQYKRCEPNYNQVLISVPSQAAAETENIDVESEETTSKKRRTMFAVICSNP